MNLILLGAPGAGKGTQAAVIRDRLDIPAISTGNIIREAIRKDTSVGRKAKVYIDEGHLVPDDIVIHIIKQRLALPDCKNGCILDGVPRTVPQAQALEDMGVIIDKVIELTVPDEEILTRLSGRRVCESCAETFHVVNKPSKKGENCDICGGKLVLRKDDSRQTVTERLLTYHRQTEPLKEFYAARGNLCVIEGQGEIEDTTALVFKALGV